MPKKKIEELSEIDKIIKKQNRRDSDSAIYVILNAMKENLSTSLKYVDESIKGLRTDLTENLKTINNLQVEMRDFMKALLDIKLRTDTLEKKIDYKFEEVEKDVFNLSDSHCTPKEQIINKEMREKYTKEKIENEKKKKSKNAEKEEIIKEVKKKIWGIPIDIIDKIATMGGISLLFFILHHFFK